MKHLQIPLKSQWLIKNLSIVPGVLICGILCSITLFVSYHRIINADLTPKWIGTMAGIGIIGIALSMLKRKLLFSFKLLNIILPCCFLLVFAGNGVTSGFDLSLLMKLGGLLLLFFFIQQTVPACHPKHLFGTVIVFALALSVQGILRYAGVISAGNSKFPMAGSFDNPAGFAAALSCALPLCFLFFADQKKHVRFSSIAIAAFIASVVCLSGSRAGMLAIAAATYHPDCDEPVIAGYKTGTIKYYREQ